MNTKIKKRGAVLRFGRMPVGHDHKGWHNYYVRCFNTREKEGDRENMRWCEWLAIYYQLLALRDGGMK